MKKLTHLPAIDQLEGFHPGGPCLYRPTLVPVYITGRKMPAWFYIPGRKISNRFRELQDGFWDQTLG